jgi:hypothetical protein
VTDELASKLGEWISKVAAGVVLAAILGSFSFLWSLHLRCDSTGNRIAAVEDALLRFRNSLTCSGAHGEYHYLCQRLDVIDMQQQRILEAISK